MIIKIAVSIAMMDEAGQAISGALKQYRKPKEVQGSGY
jgi:hypothetical protein